jgi:hypothetical protein
VVDAFARSIAFPIVAQGLARVPHVVPSAPAGDTKIPNDSVRMQVSVVVDGRSALLRQSAAHTW